MRVFARFLAQKYAFFVPKSECECVSASVGVSVGASVSASVKEGASDAEGDAGACEVGVGAEGALVQEGAVATAAAGGVVAGDAAGGGDSGGADCRSDGIHGEDGVLDGAG